MRDISQLLFSDLKSDEEKSAFFLSGRAYETGVVASAIQNELAMAYHRIVELKKKLAEAQRDSKRYHFLTGFGVTAHSPRWAHWRIERWTKDGWEPIYGNLMNAAIDAAIGEPS